MTASTAIQSGVFEGPGAVKQFLNPDNHPPLPLVELPDNLNPFRESGVRIFAKLMYLLPLLNVKSLPSINMLLEASTEGKLDGVHAVVESSSGNTAFSLGVAARMFDIDRVIALVPWDIAPGKLDMLRLCGVEPRLTKSTPSEPSAMALARQAGNEQGFFNPAQYENEANPRAYEKWVAPQLWQQTEGRLRVFAAGLGTSGTLVGAGRYFARAGAPVTLVGVMCGSQSAVPGVRSEECLREVSLPWRKISDSIIEAGAKESYKQSLELCRVGLMAGPSSGFALAGLLRFFEMRQRESTLNSLRNEDGEVVAAFICPDTPLPYLEKYSTHLDPSDF